MNRSTWELAMTLSSLLGWAFAFRLWRLHALQSHLAERYADVLLRQATRILAIEDRACELRDDLAKLANETAARAKENGRERHDLRNTVNLMGFKIHELEATREGVTR